MILKKSSSKIFLIVFLLIVSGATYAIASRTTWAPTEVKPDSVAPGETQTFEAVLTVRLGAIPTKGMTAIVRGNVSTVMTATLPTNLPNAVKRGGTIPVTLTVTGPEEDLQVLVGHVELVRNNKRVAGTQTLPIEITISSVSIPPDPGPENDDTIAGIDSNENGIRDDIERFITFTHPGDDALSVNTRGALMQVAQQLSVFLIDADDKGKSRQNDMEIERGSDCLIAANNFNLDAAFAAEDELVAEFLNTRARILAYDRADTQLVGTGSNSVPLGEVGSQCNFNLLED